MGYSENIQKTENAKEGPPTTNMNVVVSEAPGKKRVLLFTVLLYRYGNLKSSGIPIKKEENCKNFRSFCLREGYLAQGSLEGRIPSMSILRLRSASW